MKTTRIAGLTVLLTLALPAFASADAVTAPAIPLPAGFKSVQPHSATSIGKELAVLGGAVYFAADDNIGGTELWRTTGESGGTQRVADLMPGQSSSSPRSMAVAGNRLYFNANDSTGRVGVYYVDAAAPTTVKRALARRTDNGGTAETSGTVLDVVGGTAVFYRYTEAQSYTLYGLGDSGTTFEPIPGTTGARANQLFSPTAVVGGWLYFGKSIVNVGTQLWRTNGTTTQKITDAPIAPQDFVATSDRMYFTASSDGHGRELWQSNPADPADTGIVYEHNANATSTTIEFPGPVAVGNVLYYVPADDPVTGSEVWRTEGTAASTRVVQDLTPGTGGFSSSTVFPVAGGIGILRGGLVHREDGTTLADAGGDGYGPNSPVSLGDTAYFVGAASPFGQALWRTDGTVDGTLPISAAGLNDSPNGCPCVTGLTRLGDRLVFFARDAATKDNGFLKLYVLDRSVPDEQRAATAAPVITVAAGGARLDVSQGEWSGKPTAFTYQWLRNGQPIPGEVAQRTVYAVTPADVGQQITARVTTTGIGAPRFASADSAPVVPSAAAGATTTRPPSGGVAGTSGTGATPAAKAIAITKKGRLGGAAKVGRTLKLKLPKLGVSGVSITIRWYANGKVIKQQKKAKLKLSRKLKGKRISAKLTLRKAGYRTTTITVGPTKRVTRG